MALLVVGVGYGAVRDALIKNVTASLARSIDLPRSQCAMTRKWCRIPKGQAQFADAHE